MGAEAANFGWCWGIGPLPCAALMKWFSVIVLGALALFVNACEKHPAAELPPEHATAFGEHAWKPGDGNAEEKHGEEKRGEPAAPAPATASGSAAAASESPSGEVPKIFPDKK